MNHFFKDHKIRAFAKGFISCLHVRRTKDGRIYERQIAIAVRTIRNIEEIFDGELGKGIRIDCGDLDVVKDVDVFGADMRQAAYAISKSHEFTLKEA